MQGVSTVRFWAEIRAIVSWMWMGIYHFCNFNFSAENKLLNVTYVSNQKMARRRDIFFRQIK